MAFFSVKQLHAQILLQQLDLLADRRGRDLQFLGGAHDPAQPGDGLEMRHGQKIEVAGHAMTLERPISLCKSAYSSR